ncbi:MAG: hypothetical protein HKN19_12020 [Halioglobus sp.]|nr:hypothetical protein [Halioglobus sp.]
MIILTRHFYALLPLLLGALSLPASAYYIDTDDPSKVLRLRGASHIEISAVTAPLFEFAPFRASPRNRVHGFADPLGLGKDFGLRVFYGNVHYMDLLGEYEGLRVIDHVDVELPPGVVRGNQLITNYVERFFTGKVRAVDRSLYNLNHTDTRTRWGLPVTEETSPLSLAGFGSVSDFIRPMMRDWYHCHPAEIENRLRIMHKVPKKVRNKFKPPANYCFEI